MTITSCGCSCHVIRAKLAGIQVTCWLCDCAPGQPVTFADDAPSVYVHLDVELPAELAR